jgi:hypothetical protein
MMSEVEAIYWDEQGWIVSSSLENRCGQMKWTHGGRQSTMEEIEKYWREKCPHWYED